MIWQWFGFLSTGETAASMAYAVQATTGYQTYPARPRADLPPQKVCNLDPMAKVPFNYPRAPSSRRASVSLDPILPHKIVNYKYMTSTPREGYFGLPTLGT